MGLQFIVFIIYLFPQDSTMSNIARHCIYIEKSCLYSVDQCGATVCSCVPLAFIGPFPGTNPIRCVCSVRRGPTTNQSPSTASLKSGKQTVLLFNCFTPVVFMIFKDGMRFCVFPIDRYQCSMPYTCDLPQNAKGCRWCYRSLRRYP